MFYNTDNAAPTPKTVKHIFANSLDIATIQGRGADAAVYYNHADSLNSSSIMTDSAGTIAETMDYFPFGGIRIDTHPSTSSGSSAFSEQRKYIGQEYDEDTNLNYLNARYYNSSIGRFISQDPMFWNFDKDWLADPQSQNSYSYARNNPIVGSDPTGLIPTAMEAAVMASQIYQNGNEGSNLIGCWNFNFLLDSAGTGMKMGVYSRTQNDAQQSVPLEYALVSKGTTPSNTSDWKNNILQLFGISLDLNAAKTQGINFVNNNSNNETTFVGSSKGGPEAEAGALMTNKNAILFNPAPLTLSGDLRQAAKNYSAQISEYIVRGEAINLTLNNFASPLNNHDNVTYLPSQNNLSWSQVKNNGLIPSLWNNTINNHYMSSIIKGLSK